MRAPLEHEADIPESQKSEGNRHGSNRGFARAEKLCEMIEQTLFASPATIAALNRANLRAGNALKGTSLSGEAAQLAVLELNNAYFVLANDVRKHLGMEPLTLQELKATTPDSGNTRLDE